MSLKYYLVPNQMTEGPDDYMAVSSNTKSFSIEDVFDYMTRSGSTVTKAEALAVFEEITQGIFNIVQQGDSVVTPLVNIKSNISGVFQSDDDSFDSRRHQVRINVSAGLRLKEINGSIPTEKIPARERQPTPIHFIDDSSDTRDDVITPGGGARITGSLLKFDASDENQGVFFINMDDDSATRVESMLRNKPGELIFVNPDLPAGSYELEVRSLLYGNTAIRTGTLSDDLTVNG